MAEWRSLDCGGISGFPTAGCGVRKALQSSHMRNGNNAVMPLWVLAQIK